MYNIKFKVKYNDIQTELINNLKNKTGYCGENPDKPNVHHMSVINECEYEYDNQDILDICSKLYRDELLSVFNAEEITDYKIDQGMKYVYEIMMTNEKFKKLIYDLEEIYFQEFIKNEETIFKQQDSIRQLILIILFSQDIFYITHKCICQQIELSIIDKELLVELEEKSKEILLLNLN
jgi:hypothetical protein